MSEVQNVILETYQGDADDVGRGVQHLLAQLQQENLIVPVDVAGDIDFTKLAPSHNGHEKPSFNPPSLNKYSDMQELLLLDPIHDVDEAGWPKPVPDLPQ